MSRMASARRVGVWAVVLALAASVCAAENLVNRPAPEFSRMDLHGQRVDLAHYRGKVVLLNFWATWCAPCRLEMPAFVQWQKEYGGEGFQVLGVSIDDTEALVPPFVARMHLDYPVMMGDAKLGEEYGGVYGVPVTFLIDRRGIVRAQINGGANLASLQREVRKLLAEHN